MLYYTLLFFSLLGLRDIAEQILGRFKWGHAFLSLNG